MDVLQLLKAEFKDRVADMAFLLEDNGQDKQAILERVCVHLAWEANFLFPELAAITNSSEAVLTRYTQSLQDLRRQAEICRGDQGIECSKELASQFLRHNQWVEDKVLTLMRQRIPTAEREELYHVFADAKQDLTASSALEFVI